MFERSIQKSRNFKTFLEIRFSNGIPQSFKMSVQSEPQIYLFLETAKTQKSCSRLHVCLVSTFLKHSEILLLRSIFDISPFAALETLSYKFLMKNQIPERCQHRSQSEVKNMWNKRLHKILARKCLCTKCLRSSLGTMLGSCESTARRIYRLLHLLPTSPEVGGLDEKLLLKK